MDLSHITVVKSENCVENLFQKLRILTCCIKNYHELNAFDENIIEIREYIRSLVNKDNFYMFNNMFLIYVWYKAFSPGVYSPRIWDKYYDIMKMPFDKDIYKSIYYYTDVMLFYVKKNEANRRPNDYYVYNSDRLDYPKIFDKVFDNITIRRLFEFLGNSVDYIRNEYSDRDKTNLITVLFCIAASYSLVTQNYEEFLELSSNIHNNADTLYEKLTLNGIANKIKTIESKPEDDISECIKYLVESFKDNNNIVINRAIR